MGMEKAAWPRSCRGGINLKCVQLDIQGAPDI